MGDLNCRIGNAQEQWVETTGISDSNSEMEFEHVHLPVRFNQDNKSNCYGTKLMELLNASYVLVVNGRTPGDMIGNYTYNGYRGSSSIYLCICVTDMGFRIQKKNTDDV